MSNEPSAHDSRKASLLLFTAAVCWASLAVSLKLLGMRGYSPILLASVRGVGTAVVLGFSLKSWRHPFGVRSWAAALAYTLTSYTLVLAVRDTTSGTAFVLQNIAPAFVPFLALAFNGESIKRSELLGAAAVGAGIALLLVPGVTANGIITGVISGFFWALTITLHRGLSIGSATLSLMLGNVLFVPLAFWTADIPSTVSGYDIWLLPMAAILGSALPAYCFIRGVGLASSSVSAAMMLTLEPVFAMLFSALFLSEVPGFWELSGAGLILGAGLAGNSGFRVLVRSILGNGVRLVSALRRLPPGRPEPIA